MWMTEDDICVMYRQAANRQNQIVILSQLNGCQTEEIRDILIKHGYSLKPRKRNPMKEGSLTAEERARAHDLWEQGLPYKDIGREMHRSGNTIMAMAKREGWGERKPDFYWTPEQERVVWDMLMQGNRAPTIAKAMGKSTNSIYRKIRQFKRDGGYVR